MVGTTFNEMFDQHSAWRRDFALRLRLLGEWSRDHDLLDAGVEDRLKRLEAKVRADKVMIAFVGEFSRGKSELINAVFFAGYGRRIMPASAGRTTMCPTELGYDAQVQPCLRLLPIETRLQPQTLMEWRAAPEKWAHIDLNVNDPAQLALALEKVAETHWVSQAEGRALGFWHDDNLLDNPRLDSEGRMEVPRWRHALINIAHPLLKQGLVILDTPGLNAIGAEPELTVSLIPQAHAVMFILSADAGVTKSDLAIWREHLVDETGQTSARLVVLNKIDTLWDALSTPAQIAAQIERQRLQTAQTLEVMPDQVVAVSAQKALVAKVTGDHSLLERSGMPRLELALSQGILGQRQTLLGDAVNRNMVALRSEVGRVIHVRRRDLTEQLQELQGLQGKNTSVIKNMRLRISLEQGEFDRGAAKIQAVRSVHLKLLREAFGFLGPLTLRKEMESLTLALKQKGFKFGVKRAYGDTFGRLREGLQRIQSINHEIESMLGAAFRQLNAEYGFSLQAPTGPDLSVHLRDLDSAERSHLQYLGLGNAFRLSQSSFADRLVRALATRLRSIHESALADMEAWSKSAAAQLDGQLRERRKAFARRLEAIDRIHHASGGLEERIAELQPQLDALAQLEAKLQQLTHFVTDQPAAAQSAAAA